MRLKDVDKLLIIMIDKLFVIVFHAQASFLIVGRYTMCQLYITLLPISFIKYIHSMEI